MQCYCIDVAQPVETSAGRTRRAEQAVATGRRIVEAAGALFAEVGYAAATVESIAARADVAVETVYSRFRNKANLLAAVLDPVIVGNESGVDLLDLPDIARIRDCADQQEQLRLLAAFSTGILAVSPICSSSLRALPPPTRPPPSCSAVTPNGGGVHRRHTFRCCSRTVALRDGVSPAQATDTYSALADPATFALLTGERGWSAEQYQDWLADSLIRLPLRSSA